MPGHTAMDATPGWSRSRRWLLEACGRRFVLDHPGHAAHAGGPPPPHLQHVRVLRGWRNDLLADRAEGHVWSPRLMRHVLDHRLARIDGPFRSDPPARRRLVRRHVLRMRGLLEHAWFATAVPVGASIVLPDARHDVPFHNGRLWAVPDLVRDATRTVVLFRSGRAPTAVLDLEAALCVAWVDATREWPTPVRLSVMHAAHHGWLRHVVVVDDHLRRAAADLVRMDRLEIRRLLRLWRRRGHRALPLAEHPKACEGCAHQVDCPQTAGKKGTGPLTLDAPRR